MATVISVVHTKGGVGKTTITVHLARGLQLADRRRRVLALDSDSRGSMRDCSPSPRCA